MIQWENLSSRTQVKIIKRANLVCAICQWGEASVDIHHIVHQKDGGAGHPENLIAVCPNCHRKIHTFGDEFKTIKQLQELSLKDFGWEKHYNPKGRWNGKHSPRVFINRTCHECGNIYQSKAAHQQYCSLRCSQHYRRKVTRPTKEELQQLLEDVTVVAVGRKFGVSDNAIRKWAKGYGLSV